MRTFFISDTHFNHKNIMKYEPIRVDATAQYMVERQAVGSFEEAKTWILSCLETEASLKEVLKWHNEMIIAQWNKIVRPDDNVWFLGDLGFGTVSELKEIVPRLNGQKRMIYGNHDNKPISFYYDCGFVFVSRYPIILKGFFVLSHAPMPYITDNIPFFNIFGHVHSHSAYATHTSNSQCVCVERQNFMPITIKEYDAYTPPTEE